VWIRNVDFWKAVIERPNMRYGSAAVHHDDEGTFTANKVDEQLKKGIQRECLVAGSASEPHARVLHTYLVDVSEGIYPERDLERCKTGP